MWKFAYDGKDPRIKEFLEKYYALCREYRMWVDGCGCCDNPFIMISGLKCSREICGKEFSRYLDSNDTDFTIPAYCSPRCKKNLMWCSSCGSLLPYDAV